jgi:prepilin-type N-terminal cleavage/methylation domain-containing protein
MIQSKRDLAQLNSGFSLMELVVAVVLIAISSIGGTYLFNQATRQAKAISQTLEQQFAISNELAVIRDHNDRYTCATIPCSVQTGGNPPNQNQYVPANPDDPAHTPTFRQLCAVGLADNLISDINSTPKLTSSEITRLASTDLSSTGSPSSTPPQRYLVRWSSTDGRVLLQVQLMPTVAAWCP